MLWNLNMKDRGLGGCPWIYHSGYFAIIQKCAMKGSSIDTLLGAISITLSCLKSAQCFDTLLGPCL